MKNEIKDIKEATDAIFLGCKTTQIIYFSPYANDGKGSFNSTFVTADDIVRMHAESKGDTEAFLTSLLEAPCYTFEAGTEKFEECRNKYHSADFIVGRDGDEAAEVELLLKWALANQKKRNFCIGDPIWVVVRDGSEAPCCVEEKMFIASVKNVILTTDLVMDIDSTLEGFVESTQYNTDTDIEAYPASDCYTTRKSAEKALDEEFEREEAKAYVDLEDLETSYI